MAQTKPILTYPLFQRKTLMNNCGLIITYYVYNKSTRYWILTFHLISIIKYLPVFNTQILHGATLKRLVDNDALIAWLIIILYVCLNSIALQFDKLLGSNVTDVLVNFQRATVMMTSSLAAPNSDPGPLFTKKTPSYGYRDPDDKPKTVWRPSQVYNGNPYTDKTASS